jgi:BASS family bile acid:Na+ symporter
VTETLPLVLNLAVSCATRHVGIAMLAASTVPGPRVAVFVLGYVLASAVVSIPYLRWRKRTRGRRLRGVVI